ncbi:hypothetical protein QZH41_016773 [Actinostola sp. cb2023]|nr:hypothetical protein QZH41_016773 [Actinostola sp. cb2023]
MSHPDQAKAQYVLLGILHGFKIGFDVPTTLKHSKKNKPSAYQHADIIDAYLNNEVQLGRVAGPFNFPPLHPLQISSFGVIPKKGQPGLCNLCDDFGYSNFEDLFVLVKEKSDESSGMDLPAMQKKLEAHQQFLRTRFSKQVIPKYLFHFIWAKVYRSSLPVSTDTIGTQQDVDRWPHLKGIKIPSIEAEIGLLIGSDAPQILQPKEVRESENGGPYATRTVLGWVLNGPLGREKNKAATANFVDSDTELSKQFSEYCNLEFNDSTYEPKTSMSQNDRRALEIMQTTTVKLEDNHYEIALPWKNDPPCLHDNKSQAERRLQLLKKRLQKDPVVLEKYKDFMDNLLSKNHARKLSSKDLAQTAEAWYLPHHPVFHPQKPGKVRVVFDCSAKYRGSLTQRPALTGAGPD